MDNEDSWTPICNAHNKINEIIQNLLNNYLSENNFIMLHLLYNNIIVNNLLGYSDTQQICANRTFKLPALLHSTFCLKKCLFVPAGRVAIC